MPTSQRKVSIDECFLVPPVGKALLSGLEIDGKEVSASTSAGLYRILVIEDDPTLLDMYQRILTEMKLSVDLSSNGLDALENLSTTSYHLVITDLNLPGLDGISLLQWIQRHRPSTATIVISGDGRADRIQAAMRGGAKDFLVKPFNFIEFQEVVTRWCQPLRPFNSEVFSSLMKQVMHDVRGEVMNLESMIKLMQRGKFGDLEYGVNSALITMQGKLLQLKGLTADYCLLTRTLLHGNGDIPTERIGLKKEVITQVLGEMQEALQRKEIKISCIQDLSIDGDAYVMGNRLMLKSVFRALFSNAIRHCHEAGVISYGISSNGRRYKIHVANEGDIIPVEMEESIFDDFVQGKADDSVAIQEEGLGQGLALAKDILRQHGGDIWYESLANGSKFVSTLPLCLGQAAA
ncbi:MAG: response regulator [Desulfobulbaceae bacterium]|nr:response regulator [Desulfobulbaceae bacterium]